MAFMISNWKVAFMSVTMNDVISCCPYVIEPNVSNGQCTFLILSPNFFAIVRFIAQVVAPVSISAYVVQLLPFACILTATIGLNAAGPTYALILHALYSLCIRVLWGKAHLSHLIKSFSQSIDL